MNRTIVKSSTIQSVGYDPVAQTLEVEFNGGATYHYHNVPPETHAAFMASDSQGKFLHANIKGKYEFKKVEQTPPPAPGTDKAPGVLTVL